MSSPIISHAARQEDHEQASNVIVKTPTWLTSYPRRPHHSDEFQPLSPLNNEDIPLNTFVSESLVEVMPKPASAHLTHLYGTLGISNCHVQSPSVHLQDAESVGDSSIYLVSPHPDLLGLEMTYGYDVDPRSPIMHKSQVPELAFASSSLVFSRPSPSLKSERLPVQWGAPKSSLLFKSSS
ncbi:hypothetical protein CPB84DRAFT_1204232 [Gymnopilus junonius]|nr:hypothetical protein CPB84DRAFT_1204232 [Gymnopilus junonius]